jgi:XTP/dITP diphosphohydrolase
VLLLATANVSKARELAALLTGIPYRLRTLADFPGVTLPPEGADSYVENALAKARAAAAESGALALADDSGLEVDALGGAPGVLSARYGGEGLSDAERCAKLLEALKGVPPLKRSARFRCVIAIVEPAGREATPAGREATPAGREATVEGKVDGILLDEAVGTGGFGYDPIFYYPPLDATFAQLSAEEKRSVSHRGIAMARARALLQSWHRAAS